MPLVRRRLHRASLCVRRMLMCYAAVFSKSYCPYCRATKSLLSEQGAKFYVLELDQVGGCSPMILEVAGAGLLQRC